MKAQEWDGLGSNPALGREIDWLREVNKELLEALQAVAALADGQGRLNLMEVAGQASAAIAKAQS